MRHLVIAAAALMGLLALTGAPWQASQRAQNDHVFLFAYFLDNGQSGVHLAISRNGLLFEGVNDHRPILPAPEWPGEDLTRDPSLFFHEGTFHLVWTTGWWTRSIGYASSGDLVTWSAPRKIAVWPEAIEGVRNTWAPELHWDSEREEFFILFSSTLESELSDGDGSEDPHGLDHRIYVIRTRDFKDFTTPELFYAPVPEHGVIDAQVARDDRGTPEADDDRFVMVIKNEMGPESGGKNLRLAFAEHAQGRYPKRLGRAIVGSESEIVNQMAEGPSLLKVADEWRLYFDAPGRGYGLATSPDLRNWTDRSHELRFPVRHPRHGSVIAVPPAAVGWVARGIR